MISSQHGASGANYVVYQSGKFVITSIYLGNVGICHNFGNVGVCHVFLNKKRNIWKFSNTSLKWIFAIFSS